MQVTRPTTTATIRFVWDEGKYPVNAPLKETVASIQSQVAKIEDDMKVRVAEYGNVKSQLGAINRKQTGRLKVKKAIEKGIANGARIYVENAIHMRTEHMNYLPPCPIRP